MNSREEFLKALTELAEQDPRVILIVGDVGFSFVEPFAERFPNQFLNAGVTEQSFTGVAVGMALAGWKPYVYSMIPFVVFRNYEQLRNDVCYHNANVKIIGIRGSDSYKMLGFSHNPEPEDEDVLVLEHLPNLTCHIPKPDQVRLIVGDTYNNPGPSYIRL